MTSFTSTIKGDFSGNILCFLCNESQRPLVRNRLDRATMSSCSRRDVCVFVRVSVIFIFVYGCDQGCCLFSEWGRGLFDYVVVGF